MAQYELTAKANIYLGNGHTIPKGDSFTISITSRGGNKNEVFLPQNSTSVLRQLNNHGIKISPSQFTNASFLATRIR